jgi:hypothetical protein
LQNVLPLAAVFRLTAVPVVAMAVLAAIIARRQGRPVTAGSGAERPAAAGDG